jgi:hypothetical protein
VRVTTIESTLNPETRITEERKHVQVIDTRHELETRILARNKQHFAQAEGTPFTEEPLQSLTADNALAFLGPDGTPIQLPSGNVLETTTVLEMLHSAYHSPIPGIPDVVSFDDFVSGFLHWKESTSTSPSRRHLGLYCSLVTAHCDSGAELQDTTPEDISTQAKATAVLTAIHTLDTTRMARDLYLLRWIQVINVMIYKKLGVLELDELWVIHLFEAYFNLLVGLLFGRRTVQNAVYHQKLHPSQYGKKGGE